jgi:hypothetical protein
LPFTPKTLKPLFIRYIFFLCDSMEMRHCHCSGVISNVNETNYSQARCILQSILIKILDFRFPPFLLQLPTLAPKTTLNIVLVQNKLPMLLLMRDRLMCFPYQSTPASKLHKLCQWTILNRILATKIAVLGCERLRLRPTVNFNIYSSNVVVSFLKRSFTLSNFHTLHRLPQSIRI